MNGAFDPSILDDDDEHMWVKPPFSPSNPLHAVLRDWESNARCPICRDFLNIPVSIIPCHHSFCSECIRNSFKAGLKSIKRQATCPVCRIQVSATGADFKCLVPNRTVETMVKKYRELRSDLRQSLSTVANGTVAKGNATSEHGLVAPETAGTKRSRYFESSQEITSGNNNGKQELDPDERLAPRKKRARTHYNGLKRKQLVELCASEGLSTVGSEQELRSRHDAFTTLYNAECDSFHPRTLQELVQEIANREKARKNEAKLEVSNGSAVHATLMENLKKGLKEAGESNQAECKMRKSRDAKKDAESKEKERALSTTEIPNQNDGGLTSNNSADVCENESLPTDSPGTVIMEQSVEPPMMMAVVQNQNDGDLTSNNADVCENESLPTDSLGTVTIEQPVEPPMMMMMAVVNDRPCTTLTQTPSHNASSAEITSTCTPFVIDLVPEMAVASNDRRPSSRPNSIDNHFQVMTTNNTREPVDGYDNPFGRKSRKRSTRSTNGPWDCHRCTFRNISRMRSTSHCEMCQTRRVVPDEDHGYD